MSLEFLRNKIRPVTEEDRDKLRKFSYSGLSCLKQCPYQFNLTYNEGKRSSDTSLALQMGTLLHYILEQKGKMLTNTYLYPNGDKNNGKVDYNTLSGILQNGTVITDEKTKEEIIGLKNLKKVYWETWGVPDSEGRTYEQKIDTFLKVLSDEMEDDDWEPYLFEHPFEFVYDDKIILHGFIDRVDRKRTIKGSYDYRVVDYKTNKKLYDVKDLATSLQFGIYALGMLNEFDIVPVEYVYRLILLDKKQEALTLGWQKRLITALDKLVKDLEERQANDEWTPKPTPLCHWCNFCKTNSDAKQYKNECPYHSLWTPENKTFEVNAAYGNKEQNTNTGNTLDKPHRHVVF